MRILLFILFIPFYNYSQQLSEFSLIKKNCLFRKDYLFENGIDSIKSHAVKYKLISTNDDLNGQISILTKEYRERNKLLNSVSIETWNRKAKKNILQFSKFISDSLSEPVILRESDVNMDCDCGESILQNVIDDEELRNVLLSNNLKWVFISYYQISEMGNWESSYIQVDWKFKREFTKNTLIIELLDDVK